LVGSLIKKGRSIAAPEVPIVVGLMQAVVRLLARELRLTRQHDAALFYAVANHVGSISKINPR
jgi:hypothetical protein